MHKTNQMRNDLDDLLFKLQNEKKVKLSFDQMVKAPPICVDYFITQEICHLQYPQHDTCFF